MFYNSSWCMINISIDNADYFTLTSKTTNCIVIIMFKSENHTSITELLLR